MASERAVTQSKKLDEREMDVKVFLFFQHEECYDFISMEYGSGEREMCALFRMICDNHGNSLSLPLSLSFFLSLSLNSPDWEAVRALSGMALHARNRQASKIPERAFWQGCLCFWRSFSFYYPGPFCRRSGPSLTQG